MSETTAMVLVTLIVIGIPVMGLTARLAIKPLVEAVIRLRETFQPGAVGPTADAATEARLAALEARMEDMRSALQQLVEAEEFRRQLEASGHGERGER